LRYRIDDHAHQPENPPKKEQLINRAAKKEGKTKTAFILDAIDEKLRLVENREQTIT